LLADAKLHLRVDGTADNDLITAQIVAAREYVENYTNRQLITATWGLNLEEFPTEITLTPNKVLTVSSIQYYDEDDVFQTLSTDVYEFYRSNGVGRIREAYGESWPAIYPGGVNRIIVNFTAGYGAAGTDVPAPIIAAMKLIIADLYEDRRGQVDRKLYENRAVQRLLYPYRVLTEV
jgi:uncharacterized phiE125 gp8 family phage protein